MPPVKQVASLGNHPVLTAPLFKRRGDNYVWCLLSGLPHIQGTISEVYLLVIKSIACTLIGPVKYQ
jgi:hypothetical protein